MASSVLLGNAPESGASQSTLNVESSRTDFPTPLLLGLLMHFLKATYGAMTPGISALRPRKTKRLVELPTPIGIVRIGMFSGIGSWGREAPSRFITAMTASGDVVCAALERAIKSGRVHYPSTRKLVRCFLSRYATDKRVKLVHNELLGFLAKNEIGTQREATAKERAASILSYVRNCGFPPNAVTIRADGPHVAAHIVASSANLPLRVVYLHGDKGNLQRELDEIAARSRWSIGTKLYIPTINKPHGRETRTGLLVDFARLAVKRGGLLDDLLLTIPCPADHPTTQLLLRHIDLLVGPERRTLDRTRTEVCRILETAPSDLSAADASFLVEILTSRFEEKALGIRTRVEYIASFRSQVEAAFRRHGRVVPPTNARQQKTPRPNRGLVSDQPDPGALDVANQPAILSVAVGPNEDAKARARHHLDDRIQRIVLSCDAEIGRFLEWRKFLDLASDEELSPDSLASVDSVVGVHCYPQAYLEWLRDTEPSQIAAAMVAAMRSRRLYCESELLELRARQQAVRLRDGVVRLQLLFPEIPDWIGNDRSPSLALMLSAWYVPAWVQLAIELRLQVATAWNRDTVRNLTEKGVDLRGPTIDLQSIKGKTGELQHAQIEAADKLLRNGLGLMCEHSRRVDASWARAHGGIFVAPIGLRKDGKRVFGMSDDFRLLSRFRTKHQLPHFTRDQLRNQKAASRYLEKEDPHEIQGMLGHGNLAVTGNYLRHTVITVLNRANVASFQRQLAASIVWALEGPEKVVSRGMRADDVRPRLLYPISVHVPEEVQLEASCDSWMANPKAALVIDRLRLSHLVRQRAYYAAEWQRLRAEAPERFRSVHLPRIEFTAALWAIVADSPYANLLKDPG